MLLTFLRMGRGLPYFRHIPRDDGAINNGDLVMRTYTEVKFINRFTGTVITIGKNLPVEWPELMKVDYVKNKYLKYSLTEHETVDSYRFWDYRDTGKFQKAETR
jgi:hypothetical protein